jgi:tetraacyldisaccharide 4'-kinase
MMTGRDFRDLLSGQRRGWTYAAARAALRIVEAPYAGAMRLRNWRYDSGRATVHRLPAPVISVGNLTLGGTGKTPLVEWLARWLAARGARVALVSRGYGSPQAGARPASGARPAQGALALPDREHPGAEPNDEARELAEKLPGVPHFQNADRLLACRAAIAETGAQMLVLDDAFQHRRVARDLDILLVDACEPFGFEHVFPRGTLREPLCGARRAHAIGLTRRDMISASERDMIRRRFERLAPGAAWLEMRHRPTALRTFDGVEFPLAAIRGQRVAALCGMRHCGAARVSRSSSLLA